MIHNRRYLVAISVFALVAVIAVFVDHPLLRLLFGAPLVIWLPGYALTAALFPPGELSRPLRVLLTLGLSLAAVVMIGFALNLIPWGLRPIPWAVGLGCTTILAAAVALKRWRGHPFPRASGIAQDLGLPQILCFGAALVLVVTAFGVARWGALQAASMPGAEMAFTQLWVEPLTRADGDAIQVAIHNREGSVERYRLEVTAGDRIIYAWATLMVGQDQRWQQIVSLPDDAAPVEVRIYRADAPERPYRSVVLRREADE